MPSTRTQQISPSEPIDPDPVTIIMLVVAAISGVCDITNTVRDVRRGRQEADHGRARRDIGVTLVELEARLADVRASFAKLKVMMEDASSDAPFRFGTNALTLDAFFYPHFHREVQRLLTVIRRLDKVLETAIWQMYQSTLDWEQSPVTSLVEVREQCNRIIFESRSLREALSQTDRLIDDAVLSTRKIHVWLQG